MFFVTNSQPPKMKEPADAPLDFAPLLPESASMLGVSLRNVGVGSPLTQLGSILLGIVITIGIEIVGTRYRSSWASDYRLD